MIILGQIVALKRTCLCDLIEPHFNLKSILFCDFDVELMHVAEFIFCIIACFFRNIQSSRHVHVPIRRHIVANQGQKGSSKSKSSPTCYYYSRYTLDICVL